ncbi:T9SS type A sorting domain-containing protein [Rubricoccus marinus]|uniref:Secretion system C-terminal sorting domain-containing protein n=1 Tax=Rubricoccus marinus TaxID=716817 RepID=A0A259TZL9_9BACT|nr:T9SS type A sorting domain-containing protein [Rubricoccus marinus]OZC03223.1 hypothetical protein BSZ36_09695 [Rubricoccus marinus]
MTKTLSFLAAALLFLALAPEAQAQVAATDLNCTTNSRSGDPRAAPNGHISWPADDPVWEFDFLRPGNSTTQDGTGLEIRDVYYDGRLVMKKGNVPVLNVEYDPGAGGCGCFRDWQYDESSFIADGVDPQNTCFAQSTPGDVQTTCEYVNRPTCDPRVTNPNASGYCGESPYPQNFGFEGVAVEDYGDELVLTMHTSAGWYRYRMKWHFYLDGRIWPEYSFAAGRATCTEKGHRHHAYWRFDFDLEGTPNNDIVREHNAAGVVMQFDREADRTWGNPADGVYWTVEDAQTRKGYGIYPSDEDLKLPIDAFSKTDALVLQYDATEMDDGSVGCAIDYQSEQNNESIVGEDIVFWYRSSALHQAGNPWECDIVGPELRPLTFGVAGEPQPATTADNGFRLDTAGPNPFTPFTSVRFQIPEAGSVVLDLYDSLGRKVQTLFEGDVAGQRDETVRINGFGLPSGTYTVRLSSGGQQATTRVVLVR